MVRLQCIGNERIDGWIKDNASDDGITYVTVSCKTDSMFVATTSNGDYACIPTECIVTDLTDSERTSLTDLVQMSVFDGMFF